MFMVDTREQRFSRIGQQMRLLADAEGVARWAKKHHGDTQVLTTVLGDRYPLVVFHGDVGTGKTATAEAAANALCEEMDTDGFLLKLSTRVRGVGHVGEMSSLIGDAFAEVFANKESFLADLCAISSVKDDKPMSRWLYLEAWARSRP